MEDKFFFLNVNLLTFLLECITVNGRSLILKTECIFKQTNTLSLSLTHTHTHTSAQTICNPGKWFNETISFRSCQDRIDLLLTRLSAMQLIARLCCITMLNPDLLFMIALRHMMHTWMSSVVSPILSFVECRISFDIRGPSRSRLEL